MAIEKSQLRKLDDYRWLVPCATKPGMRTDALIYADSRLLEQIVQDLSVEQAMNVAFLPGIVGRSLAMPDIHQGYGFPDRKSTRLNSSHDQISYAVFCLKKKKITSPSQACPLACSRHPVTLLWFHPT